jgi:hypothetical protein
MTKKWACNAGHTERMQMDRDDIEEGEHLEEGEQVCFSWPFSWLAKGLSGHQMVPLLA